MPTEVEILGRITTAQILDAIRTVTMTYAESVRDVMAEDRPRPPARGTMVYKSEKQRRFVMASIKRGQIKVPYVRGDKAFKSQTLNRSYRLDLEVDDVVLSSGASYAPYVAGDQQAPIHQGRWTTARQAADRIADRGDLQRIVDKVMASLGDV